MAETPTLSEFFRDVFTPLRINASQLNPKTVRGYMETLKLWVKLTGDPPLSEVTDIRCAQWVTDLAKEKGKSGGTMMKSSIRKHCVNLTSMLLVAGPRARHRLGQGIIPFVPFVPMPRLDKAPPSKDWSIEEVRSIYAASRVAKFPKLEGVDPRQWWEAFCVFAYYTGFRIESIILSQHSMIHGQWLHASSDIMKQGGAIKQFLHPTVIEHINRIRRPESDFILNWPRWSATRTKAYDQFYAIQEAAGLPESRQWGFHSYRRTHVNHLREATFEQDQSMSTTQRSVGHSNSRITNSFYVSGTLQDRLLAVGIMAMASPLPQVERSQPPRVEEPPERPTRPDYHNDNDFID